MTEPASGPTSSKKSKRHSSYQELWNNAIGKHNPQCIPTNRLPTNRVIMQRYHTLKTESGIAKTSQVRPFACIIIDKLMNIWAKAKVLTKDRKACVEQILRLINSWSKFLADSHKSDPSETVADHDSCCCSKIRFAVLERYAWITKL